MTRLISTPPQPLTAERALVVSAARAASGNHLRAIYDKPGFWNRVERALWYEARRHENLAYEQSHRAAAGTARAFN